MNRRQRKCYVLCFGRTDFTAATVDSLTTNAESELEVILLNNGWLPSVVPVEIFSYWKEFTSRYLKQGKVARVIDIPTVRVGDALSAFAAYADIPQDTPYFITDNDCIINTPKWDTLLEGTLSRYPAVNKLGVDFYRSVTFDYCNRFSAFLPGIKDYMQVSGNRVSSTKCMDYFEWTGKPNVPVSKNGDINAALTDTTLSVVRGGVNVTQQEDRISYGVPGLEMLHVGYLESLYYSGDEVAVYEMLHYHNIRPHVLTQFAADYEARKRDYIRNLVNYKNAPLIDRYNKIISK